VGIKPGDPGQALASAGPVRAERDERLAEVIRRIAIKGRTGARGEDTRQLAPLDGGT
jgi:hypothetical protein